MKRELWTANRLSVELQRDRRAIAKWLDGLEPVETRKLRNRTERSYHLVDVFNHLLDARIAELVGEDPDGSRLDLEQQRARLAKAQADKTEIEVRVRNGELLPARDVVNHWAQKITAARSILLALPTKLAAQMVAVTSLPEAESKLRAEVHRSLEELADQPRYDV